MLMHSQTINIPYPGGGHNGGATSNTTLSQNHRGIWTNFQRPVIIRLLYFNFEENDVMATYAGNKCGMTVNTSCAKCDVALVDDSPELDNGTGVQISKSPSCAGKVKSPSCCGEEMACSI